MAEEQVTPPVATPPAEPAGLNIDNAVADIASALSLSEAPKEETPPPEGEPPPEGGAKAEPTPEGSPPAVAEPPKDAAKPPEGEVLPAPDTWRKEAKEAWKDVPPVVREELQKREADISKFVGETKPFVEAGSNFMKVMEPIAHILVQQNINPYAYTQSLVQGHMTLMMGPPEQKAAMFTNLARDAGIDLKALAEGRVEAVPQDAKDKQIAALTAKVNDLERGVTSVAGGLHAARAAELENDVLAFGQDAVAHPYFWELSDDITALIANSPKPMTLEQAYNTAVAASPVYRQKLVESEAERSVAAKAAAEKERVEKAKKAAAANVHKSAKGRAATVPGSIDDTLKEALAEIHSRES